MAMRAAMGYLERNNAQGAVEVYIRRMLDGTWTPDDARWIMHMQDDPGTLLSLINQANELPELSLALEVARASDAIEDPPRRPWDDRRSDAMVVKGGGHAANGHGYNPYRAAGKFASGPHKERPKTGRQATAVGPAKATESGSKVVKKATASAPGAKTSSGAGRAKPQARVKFDDSKHKSTIAEHKKIEAFHRTESLKIVAKQREIREQAKALPKSDKKGRAELKDQHQALGKQRDVHKAAATEARTSRVAESKAMQEAKKQHVVTQATGKAPPTAARPNVGMSAHAETTAPAGPSAKRSAQTEMVAGDKRRPVIATDTSSAPPPNEYASKTQWSPVGQAALQEHHADVAKSYGLHHREDGFAGSKSVMVMADRDEPGMPVINGSHGHDGSYDMREAAAVALRAHAKLDAAQLAGLGHRAISGDREAGKMLEAYRISTHESLHGFGPKMLPASRNGIQLDEMATELVARKIVGDIHGLHSSEVPGSYDRYITPAINEAMAVSGKTRRDVHEAMTEAALDLKRTRYARDARNGEDGSGHARAFSANMLNRLGVSGQGAHDSFYKKLDDIDNDQPEHAAQHPHVDRL